MERHHRAFDRAPEEPLRSGDPDAAKPDNEGSSEIEPAKPALPTDRLTLGQATTIALRDNPDIHAARARLAQATARIALARSRYFPVVSFSHGDTRTFNTPASRNRLAALLQPQPSFPVDINDSNDIALSTILNALRRPLFGGGVTSGDNNSFSEHSTAFTASWVMFDGMVRQADLTAAQFVQRASRESFFDVRRLLVSSVEAAYQQVQLAEEELRIARADEAFSREQLDEAEKLRRAGRAPQSDVDNFRIRMLAAQSNVAAATGRRDTGRVVLVELMGLEDGGLPPELPLEELAVESDADLTAPDADAALAQALVDRPDLRQLERLAQAEEQSVRAARGAYSPTLTVSGSWGFDKSGNIEYGEDDQSSAAAIEMRWDLYTGGARTARVREAEGRYAEAMANWRRLRLQVQSDVRAAAIDVVDAQQRIMLQRENLTTAQENRRVIQAAYVAGRESLSRLNEAQRDVIAADVNLALARVRLRRAWSDLRAATGSNVNRASDGTSALTLPIDDAKPVTP